MFNEIVQYAINKAKCIDSGNEHYHFLQTFLGINQMCFKDFNRFRKNF